MTRARLGVAFLITLLLSWTGAPSAAQDTSAAQGDSGTTFHDRQDVTAVDLLVGIELEGAAAFKAWGKGLKLPSDVALEDFGVRVDGVERRVVAMEEIRDDRPVASEPWTQVIFIDVLGSRTRDLGMGLDALAYRAEDLVEIGPVRVIQRRSKDGMEVLETVMEPTRDGGELRKVLAGLALTVEGQDDLSDVRYELRRELLDRPWTERAAERRIAKALRAETSRVIAHQDTLLTYLADVSLEAGARRAVYWVTSGFDPAPHDYYGVTAPDGSDGDDGASGLRPIALDDVILEDETEGFARALSSYGWVVFPVVPPAPDPLRGKGSGKRLGKWRFQGLMANYEAERLPDRAEAYLELADAHAGGGRWQEAAEAYDRAYFHFWGDPRTKSRQAEALAGLGEALDHLGEDGEARRSLEMAAALDPEVASGAVRERVTRKANAELWTIRDGGDAEGRLSIDDRLRFVEGALRSRFRPLESIAAASSGRRLADQKELFRTLDDLRLRLRLTFQLGGVAPGEVLGVAATWKPREEHDDALRVRRWVRFGVPARFTRAVARRMLPVDAIGVGSGIEGVLRVEPLELVAGALDLRVEGRPGVRPPHDLRVVLAAGGNGEPTRTLETLWTVDGPPPALRLQVHEPVLAVVWQDVETGAWGGGRFPTGLD